MYLSGRPSIHTEVCGLHERRLATGSTPPTTMGPQSRPQPQGTSTSSGVRSRAQIARNFSASADSFSGAGKLWSHS